LAHDCIISIASGDIAIHPRCDEFINAIINSELGGVLHSTCVVFSEKISSLIKLPNWVLNKSLDAGTRETYAKVKGKNVFDTVVENIKRYSVNGGNIQLKYIIMLENSNEEDLKGFAGICDIVRPQNIQLSGDLYGDFDNLHPKILDFAIELGRELLSHGHEVLLLDHFGADGTQQIRLGLFGG
jgi:MoaA/NifB/PqqE/SkfB family radical SAM enzyme